MENKNDKDVGWFVKGSHLNQMLNCGPSYNGHVQNALEYLPCAVFNKIKTSMAIYSTNEIDGCRLAREVCKSKESILISERIFPRRGATEGDNNYRYFIFVVLHEIAHAYLIHLSPKFDSLTANKIEAQENEADDLAFQWFNDYIVRKANPYLTKLTPDEVNKAKAKSKEEREAIYRS